MFKQTIVSTVCALSAGISMAGGISADSGIDLSASSAAAVHAQSANHEQDAQLQSAARAQSSAGFAFDPEQGASFEGSHSSEANTNASSQHAGNNHSEANGSLATNGEQARQQLDQRQSHLRSEADTTLSSAGNAAAAAQGQVSATATHTTQLVVEGGNTAILVLGERRAAVEAETKSHAANAGNMATDTAAESVAGIKTTSATAATTAATAQSSVAGAANGSDLEATPVTTGVAVDGSASKSLVITNDAGMTSQLQSTSTVAGSIDADLSPLNQSMDTDAEIAGQVVAEVDAAVSAAIAESVSQAVAANVQSEVSNSLAESLGANL